MMNKLIFIAMSFLGSIFGACAQTDFDNVDVTRFEELLSQEETQLLDVRTLYEYEEAHIKGTILIDANHPDFIDEAVARLDKDKPVAVYCRSGRRSAMAAQQLFEKGFKVYNLNGGILDWIEQGKPVEKANE